MVKGLLSLFEKLPMTPIERTPFIVIVSTNTQSNVFMSYISILSLFLHHAQLTLWRRKLSFFRDR